jgi:hypothetical protein
MRNKNSTKPNQTASIKTLLPFFIVAMVSFAAGFYAAAAAIAAMITARLN